jgi:signal transduction histidine kinase/CheY-like chemotaxis protein
MGRSAVPISEPETILTMEIRFERDVVLARQRARQIADLLGFDAQDQARIATAVSEMARNALQHAQGGNIEFLARGLAGGQSFAISVRDEGPGIRDLTAILQGRLTPERGVGLGIVGARRLMDHFHIDSTPDRGTAVSMGKTLPSGVPAATRQELAHIRDELARSVPQDPFAELRHQNRELLHTLEELHQRQEELIVLNRELEDTNRGVVALYSELDERAEHLRRAAEWRARVLSTMSHEFRTPVGSIIGLSQILLDRLDGELTSEQEKQVLFIRQAAQHLLELVNDLLDMAKIEAGRATLHLAEFEVADLFGTLAVMMRHLETNPAVQLVFEEPVGLAALNTDENKVSQILRNLISNALKYTERGEVRVSATLDAPGGTIAFAVTDTGIGIAPEDQDRIFEEFFQVASPVGQDMKGTGLGLALSRGFAELLGGSLVVESAPGVGSTFTAVIPLTYEGEGPAVAAPPRRERAGLPVLVVEDDLSTIMLYERYLSGSGFEVIPALTVREARRVLKGVRPMAIVLDILLPGEDGWSFLVELKGDERTRDIPVLVATIVDDQREQGMLFGAEDYCVKPVGREWLLDRLQSLDPVEKVLIIDDDEAARYSFTRLLGGTPYTVIEAVDGPEGLQRARDDGPQVIFLDLMMPGLSGFDVLELLKSDPVTRDIPVIIYTVKELQEDERQRLMRRAMAILSKVGTSREEVIAQISDALDLLRKT